MAIRHAIDSFAASILAAKGVNEISELKEQLARTVESIYTVSAEVESEETISAEKLKEEINFEVGFLKNHVATCYMKINQIGFDPYLDMYKKQEYLASYTKSLNQAYLAFQDKLETLLKLK